jgi:dihydroneopterin aldolase
MTDVTNDTGTDTVEIRGLEYTCIVGIYPAERRTPQPLVVDVALGIDTRLSALREEIGATVDYARLAADVRFLLHSCQFQLIETAAEVLACYALLTPLLARPPVLSARVQIQKPRAVPGAVATVRISRRAAQLTYPVEVAAGETVERVFSGKDYVVERRRLPPHHDGGVVTHRTGDAHELVLTSDLSVNGVNVPVGSAHTFGSGVPRHYRAGASEQALLCVRHPSAHLLPSDVAIGALPRATLF